ncbi:hypothetical protein DRE_01402 [Drechslerella stenobrocha 248]|uniref:Hyaluronan/mRNA-binding protein domain-containing protein n=1 Tax=Drechslerella stenobrocha 248 TaxID=1043628 RepID=W7I5P7_9PEZI|nr:hypothetical protein DRE_01402 [Drechslerella stenobrocha 248]
MTDIVSKNLFDLLGNDIEDENEIPKPPMREITRKTTSSKKTDAPPPVAADSRAGATRRPRGEGNDAVFRDRGNGRENNRSKPTDDGLRERGDRGPRGRGGRGRGRQFDRHSGTGREDTEKQVSQGWGSNRGNSEWNDEQAGENIAQAEATNDAGAPATTEQEGQNDAAEAEAPEPEDKTKSFAEYQAELQSRGQVEDLPEARRAGEGTRANKKWAEAKELVKNDDEEYFAGEKFKQKNQKQRKEKAVVEIDHGFIDPRSTRRPSGDRGNRGSRGGARGDRPPRGSGGGYRGDSSRGSRGGARGGFNPSDESAFPSLGSK